MKHACDLSALRGAEARRIPSSSPVLELEQLRRPCRPSPAEERQMRCDVTLSCPVPYSLGIALVVKHLGSIPSTTTKQQTETDPVVITLPGRVESLKEVPGEQGGGVEVSLAPFLRLGRARSAQVSRKSLSNPSEVSSSIREQDWIVVSCSGHRGRSTQTLSGMKVTNI